MGEEKHGFFNNDGTPMNPNLASKPSLCVSCKYDDDPKQYALCALNRMDQQKDEDFICNNYEKKNQW